MRLPESLWKKVQHHAIDHGLTLQDLVSRALVEYLDRNTSRVVKVRVKTTTHKLNSVFYHAKPEKL
jgi:hypothetical protein